VAISHKTNDHGSSATWLRWSFFSISQFIAYVRAPDCLSTWFHSQCAFDAAMQSVWNALITGCLWRQSHRSTITARQMGRQRKIGALIRIGVIQRAAGYANPYNTEVGRIGTTPIWRRTAIPLTQPDVQVRIFRYAYAVLAVRFSLHTFIVRRFSTYCAHYAIVGIEKQYGGWPHGGGRVPRGTERPYLQCESKK